MIQGELVALNILSCHYKNLVYPLFTSYVLIQATLVLLFSFYIPFLECKHPEATEVQHHLAFIREKTNTLDWEKNNRHFFTLLLRLFDVKVQN